MSYRMDGLRTARLTAVSATGQIGSGDNGVITTTVTQTGGAGNGYSIRVVLGAGISQPLAAALNGQAITVTLATDGDELPDDAANTATLIAAAVDALDGVTAVASGTGATPISAAVSAVTFSGGRDVHTLDRLASLSGFNVTRLAHVERGRRVSPKEAQRLADALATTLSGLSAAAL